MHRTSWLFDPLARVKCAFSRPMRWNLRIGFHCTHCIQYWFTTLKCFYPLYNPAAVSIVVNDNIRPITLHTSAHQGDHWAQETFLAPSTIRKTTLPRPEDMISSVLDSTWRMVLFISHDHRIAVPQRHGLFTNIIIDFQIAAPAYSNKRFHLIYMNLVLTDAYSSTLLRSWPPTMPATLWERHFSPL